MRGIAKKMLVLMTVMILCAMYFVPLWQGRAGLLAVIIFNYIFLPVGSRPSPRRRQRN